MSGAATTAAMGARARPGVRQQLGRAADRWSLPVYTAFAVAYLLLPIAVMIVFSFNDPPGKFNFVWGEFSLDAWANPVGRPGLGAAVGLSLGIAAVSTLIATALGTLIALSLTRYQFAGRSATSFFIFIPMATPEIVLGASLLTLFVATAQEPLQTFTGGLLFPLGPLTILIAHVMFNISYVVVTVKARMAGFDRNLEEAAMDLGANEWVTFWRVTFPLIFPGIMAAALLAFSLSIDDFIITYFNAGHAVTFPIAVWASVRNNFPPHFNVIGTIIFVVAVGSIALATLVQRLRRGRA